MRVRTPYSEEVIQKKSRNDEDRDWNVSSNTNTLGLVIWSTSNEILISLRISTAENFSRISNSWLLPYCPTVQITNVHSLNSIWVVQGHRWLKSLTSKRTPMRENVEWKNSVQEREEEREKKKKRVRYHNIIPWNETCPFAFLFSSCFKMQALSLGKDFSCQANHSFFYHSILDFDFIFSLSHNDQNERQPLDIQIRIPWSYPFLTTLSLFLSLRESVSAFADISSFICIFFR